MSESTEELRCSFCNKERREVRKLISGPQVYICDECVTECINIVEQEESNEVLKCPKPVELVAELDKYCVGQAEAKKTLAVAVYNHYKRIHPSLRKKEVEIQKGNVLLIGPTGCGKTLLAQTLARTLNVPFVIADATTLTEAGYVGEDVESVIKHLFRNANGDITRTQQGIIFIDEIDKISRRADGFHAGRDVGGEGVQQGLLKLLEGKQASFSPEGTRGRPQSDVVQVDTTNILFVCSGAFTGLEEIIRQRVQKRGMGFGSSTAQHKENLDGLRSLVRTEDLVQYGMIPEFLGRLPVTVTCDALDEKALVDVLWRPKNSLVKQYQRLLRMDGVDLHFTDEALLALAKEAVRKRAGARGLRALLEEVMLEVMYEIPSRSDVNECLITEETILKKQKPVLVPHKKAS